MPTQEIVQGTLNADGTLELDHKPQLPAGRVQVIVMPLPALPPDDPFWQRLQALWTGQQASGHLPRSEAEIETERQTMRDEWDQRMERIERVQAEAEQARRVRGRTS